MTLRRVVLGALALATVLPGAAFADRDHHDGRGRDDRRHEEKHGRRTWIEGRYEIREIRRVVPAVTRTEWVPDRYETVVIPAVVREVRVPAVVERVWVPETRERVYVPAVTERVGVGARIDVRFDRHGFDFGGLSLPHYETRVVREARWETRCIPGHFEERVVSVERCETRIVVPERCERRLVECGHWRTVIVCAERVEVACERVWIPGRYEERRDRRCD
jgi:hypothetical protein